LGGGIRRYYRRIDFESWQRRSGRAHLSGWHHARFPPGGCHALSGIPRTAARPARAAFARRRSLRSTGRSSVVARLYRRPRPRGLPISQSLVRANRRADRLCARSFHGNGHRNVGGLAAPARGHCHQPAGAQLDHQILQPRGLYRPGKLSGRPVERQVGHPNCGDSGEFKPWDKPARRGKID
jgi:hypothetical protein